MTQNVSPGAPVLHADSIARTLGGQRVLAAATLSSHRGVVTALLGRMGAGKSTLLRICAGAMRPDSGWIRFLGEQHFVPRQHELARRGMLYLADRDNLLATQSLEVQLRIVASRFGSTARLDDAIDRLALSALRSRAPVRLSGGERRRAELALALLRRPCCALVDEPFRGLDPVTAELIGHTLRSLAGEGCAVVVTGHEVPALVPWADEIVWMTAGTTHVLGDPASAWSHHQFQREYLGPALVRAGPPPRGTAQQPA